MRSDDARRSSLVRGLSLMGATSVVVGTVIGTGVFLKARVMTCNLDSPILVLLAWVTGGLLALAGALTYGELAAMKPQAGGEYVFIRDGYGRRLAFVYGWTQFAIVFPASQAAKAVGFAVFLNVLTSGGLQQDYFTLSAFGLSFPFGPLQIVALAIVFAVTLINCAAVTLSDKVLSFLTCVKALFVLAIGVGAFLLAQGDFENFTMINRGGTCEGVSSGARGGLAGFGAALLGALWAYDGWINLTIVAGEVKNPGRNLPLALIGGMLCILILYTLINAAYFYVLSPTEIASVLTSSSVATEVAQQFVGPAAVGIMAAGLMISTLGSLYSGIMAGARIPFAMARDQMFFSGLARVSQNSRVPVNALIVQWLWINILTLSGSFDSLTDYAMFAAWIFYAISTSTIFLFRKRMPDAPRPYRTLGYPVVPIVFIVSATFILINTVWTLPLQSLIGLGLIGISVPIYEFWKKNKSELG